MIVIILKLLKEMNFFKNKLELWKIYLFVNLFVFVF